MVCDLRTSGRFRKFPHIKQSLNTLYVVLHLTNALHEHFYLGKRRYHGHGQHHCKHQLGYRKLSVNCQIQTYRQGSKKRGGEQCKGHFHGNPCRGQPFHNELLIVKNSFRIFLIRSTSSAKSLNYFNSFYVFHNCTVHMSIGFIILGKAPAAYDHSKNHEYHG